MRPHVKALRFHYGALRLVGAGMAFGLITFAAFAQRDGDHGRAPGGAGRPAIPGPAPSRPAPAPAARAWAPAGRPDFVDRTSHGSVRHAETHVVPHFDSGRHVEGQ